MARIDGDLILRFSHLGTSAGALRRDIGAFFRKDYRTGPPPDFAPYAVRIWVATADWGRPPDVDNVAKACLDALSGIVWRDDRQVVSLTVEKVAAETDSITLCVGRVGEPGQNPDLESMLARLDTLERETAS